MLKADQLKRLGTNALAVQGALLSGALQPDMRAMGKVWLFGPFRVPMFGPMHAPRGLAAAARFGCVRLRCWRQRRSGELRWL